MVFQPDRAGGTDQQHAGDVQSKPVDGRKLCRGGHRRGGSATGAVAALTVYVLPGISNVVANANGSFTLNLLGTPGETYILQSATNLLLPVDWLPLATNTLGTNGVWQFTDS
jgi:hypothetical protein